MKFRRLLLEAQFHGSRRLGQRKHSYYWAVALLIFLVLAACVISATVRRFLDNPTYLSRFSTQHYRLKFPAVLVCPELTFPDHKMDTLMQAIQLPQGVNASYVRSIMPKLAAFYSPDVIYNPKELELLQQILDYNFLSVENVGLRLTSSCQETILRCRWLGKIMNCTELFQMELTGVGFCCVFNGRSLYRDIKEYGLRKQISNVENNAERAGLLSGLLIVVNQSQIHNDVDTTYKWVGVINGQFYVDYPVNGTPISPGSENWFVYLTETYKITDDAKSLSDHLRQCKMSYDPIQYFPYYQKEYCLWECEIKRTISRCGCLAPIHPLIPGHPRCRARELHCVRTARTTFDTDQCYCPRTCDSVRDIVYKQRNVLSNTLSLDEIYNGLDYKKITVIRVFIGSHKSETFVRNSYFGTTQLFAQIGGEFSVFFGCSVLTLLELFQLTYHWIYMKYKNEIKTVDENSKFTKKEIKRNNKIKVKEKKRAKKVKNKTTQDIQ